MKIGIHDADAEHLSRHRGHKPFPNYALMKISAYHKALGDTVEWFSPMERYDRVYSSKVFDFTPENLYLPPDTIKGGTGYGLFNNLSDEIDGMFPDYSIYPDCDYAIGYITRGCPNNCSWCYVPRKEGSIKPYRAWEQLVRPDTDKLVLMDNNILACEYGIEQLESLINSGYRIDLNQGMDIRLVNERICGILARLKWINYIRFSCDTQTQLPYFERAISLFDKKGVPKSKVFVYVLVRSDLNEADIRVRRLHEICRSFSIYAQAERNEPLGIIPNKAQLEFSQRYVYGRCYKKESWQEYCQRKGLDYDKK